MEIRRILPSEAHQHYRVSSASFIWNYEQGKETFPENDPIIGAFDDGELIAEAECMYRKSYYFGNLIEAVGIGGVASLPNERRKGAVAKIFDHLEEQCAKDDITIGILHAFSFSYYRKFGYEQAMRHAGMTVPFEYTSHIPRSSDVRLYEGDENDTKQLLNVYNNVALSKNLMFRRDSTDGYESIYSKEPFKDCKYTYIYPKHGVAQGYVTFEVKRSERKVNINEIMFDSKDSLLALLGFLRNYDGITRELVFGTLPLNSPLFEIFGEYNKMGLTLGTGEAVRIYDVEKILRLNKYPADEGSFRLRINDTIDKNNAVFDVKYKDGMAKINRESHSDDYDICLNACAAVRFLYADGIKTAALSSYANGVIIKGNTDDFFRAFNHECNDFYESF